MLNRIEIWKGIIGFERYYEVSNFSRVRRLRREVNCKNGYNRTVNGRVLTPIIDAKGYHTLILSKRGNACHFKIHRLFAIAFLPNPENKPFINHRDGNKANNLLENLEWVTASENIQHAYDTKLKIAPRGENQGLSKLKEEQVIQIKNLLGKVKQREIARIFDVTPQCIHSIKTGRTWSHIKQTNKTNGR